LAQVKKFRSLKRQDKMGNNKIGDTPWKAQNEIRRRVSYPVLRLVFAWHGIPWGSGWRIYGLPIIQKHRRSG
jgi:hypothetical protein